ncbi:aminotransferase class I/II-fold pyridoxal phosphate-dependent enzyme [Metabacillus schmidteae]|uniref:aminotransferase class I/II-fold pyridoxal phosphate-dependent enzyme n=1 Tax=Metabacillus schmidteae TaxID=2730405 RepID=UPI00158B4BBE|nr:aminotransferase class I/II-fold pyridoxal phosphate-dependent enzyme [Metabacillus schmidteae]
METPLYSALLNHANAKPLSLHVPGHKNGAVFLKEANHLYRDILHIDVTELTGLDDLHDPQDVILAAQQLTANVYGVKNSYFLVNGSTVGNLAMILSTCEEGDEVLVQRNSHKSIMYGLQLAGVKPIFLSPKMDEEYHVPSYIEIETVREALDLFPNAKALILTSPNYYGLSIDLKEIVTLAHGHGIPVLVDEAHGAHFIIGNGFPPSAIEAGADIVIHSAHKTLPAMTMGSYLHFNSNYINQETIETYLSMLQSSSPSYPIMASLDIARAYLKGIIDDKKQGDIIKSVKDVKTYINSISGIEVVESIDPVVHNDPLKVTIRSTNKLSGYQLQELFEANNINVELANYYHCLCILPLADSSFIINKLKHLNLSLKKTERPYKIKAKSQEQKGKRIQSLDIPYSHLKKYKKRIVEMEKAVGYYSAEAIIPYPPGIPLIIVGEKITTELIEKIKELLELGVNIQGDHHIKKGKISIYMK